MKGSHHALILAATRCMPGFFVGLCLLPESIFMKSSRIYAIVKFLLAQHFLSFLRTIFALSPRSARIASTPLLSFKTARSSPAKERLEFYRSKERTAWLMATQTMNRWPEFLAGKKCCDFDKIERAGIIQSPDCLRVLMSASTTIETKTEITEL